MSLFKRPVIPIVAAAFLIPVGMIAIAAASEDSAPKVTTKKQASSRKQPSPAEIAETNRRLWGQSQMYLNFTNLPKTVVQSPNFSMVLTNLAKSLSSTAPSRSFRLPIFRNPNPAIYYDQRDVEMKRLFPNLSATERQNSKYDLMYPMNRPRFIGPRLRFSTVPSKPKR